MKTNTLSIWQQNFMFSLGEFWQWHFSFFISHTQLILLRVFYSLEEKADILRLIFFS